MPSQSKDAGGVAGRYANALYELADKSGLLDKVADDLKTVLALADQSPEFARVLKSPVLGRDQQGRAVTAVAEQSGLDPLTVRFLGTLAANRRLAALPSAVDAFLSELAHRRGEVSAEVTSAQPLTESHVSAVTQALSDALGSRIALKTRVDPALIGGMIVRVGSRMVDFSLATKLQKLRLSMKGIG